MVAWSVVVTSTIRYAGMVVILLEWCVRWSGLQPRDQAHDVVAIDGGQIARAEPEGREALHVIGGRPVREIGTEHDLGRGDEPREGGQRTGIGRLGDVVVEALEL